MVSSTHVYSYLCGLGKYSLNLMAVPLDHEEHIEEILDNPYSESRNEPCFTPRKCLF